MKQHLRRYGVGYLVAIGATAVAMMLRLSLAPLIGTSVPFSTQYAAIALAVWYGGYRSGLLAAVLGYLASNYFFMEPRSFCNPERRRSCHPRSLPLDLFRNRRPG